MGAGSARVGTEGLNKHQEADIQGCYLIFSTFIRALVVDGGKRMEAGPGSKYRKEFG